MSNRSSISRSELYEKLRPMRLGLAELEIAGMYSLMAELEEEGETVDYSQHLVSIVRLGQTSGRQTVELEFLKRDEQDKSTEGFPFHMSPSNYMIPQESFRPFNARYPLQEQPLRLIKQGFLVGAVASFEMYVETIKPRDDQK